MSKFRKNIYKSDVQVYFELNDHLGEFRGILFQINLHLLNTVLLIGFQSSLGALESTEQGSTW